MTNNLTDKQKRLVEACTSGDVDVCERLLGEVDPNFSIDSTESLLDLAILNWNSEIIELLLRRGAVLDLAGWHGSMDQHPLAIMGGLSSELRNLLFRNAQNADYKANGTTSFMFAICVGNFGEAEHLLDGNVDVHRFDENGWSPINRILSIISKTPEFEYTYVDDPEHTSYVDLINTILGINITAEELSFDRHLHWRHDFDDLDEFLDTLREPAFRLIKRLIQMGCDVTTANDYGWTPLLFASRDKWLSDVCVLLVEAGAEVNVVEKTGGYTPLSRACDGGNTQVALMLLEHGADPCFQDPEWGYTALTRASIDLDVALVKRLIEKGADVNSVSASGATPLVWTLSVNGGIVNLFDEMGEEANAAPIDISQEKIVDFPTPSHPELFIDARVSELELIVRLLLENGASPFIRNEDGKNAYDILESCYFFERLKDVIPPLGPREIL